MGYEYFKIEKVSDKTLSYGQVGDKLSKIRYQNLELQVIAQWSATVAVSTFLDDVV